MAGVDQRRCADDRRAAGVAVNAPGQVERSAVAQHDNSQGESSAGSEIGAIQGERAAADDEADIRPGGKVAARKNAATSDACQTFSPLTTAARVPPAATYTLPCE